MSEASSGPLDRAGAVLLGLSMICVAALCLYSNDFAGPRQPVPPGWSPRNVLIDLNIAALGGGGLMLLMARWRRPGAAVIASWVGLWVIVLHGPRMLAGKEAAWLGAAECLAIALAAARATHLDARTERAIDLGYALCLFAFGAAHFIYLQITANMVPAWLPARLFWAGFTGAAHIAAGISLAAGVWTRLGTRLLALMLTLFTLLVNLPIALKDGGAGHTLLDLCFAVALTASALLMAGRR